MVYKLNNNDLDETNSNLLVIGKIDKLIEFTGEVLTKYTFDDILYLKYSLLIMELFDTNNNVVNSVITPLGTLTEFGGRRYVYGTSIDMWGFIEIVDLTTKTLVNLNRTSSNTSKINVYGVRKLAN